MKLILVLLIVVFLVSVFADPEATDRSHKDDGKDEKSCHRDDKSCKDRRCRKDCCQGPEGLRGPEGPYGRDGLNGLNGRDGADCVPVPLPYGQIYSNAAQTVASANNVAPGFISFPLAGLFRGTSSPAADRITVQRGGNYLLTTSVVYPSGSAVTVPGTCSVYVNGAALTGPQYSFLVGPGSVNTLTVAIPVPADNSYIQIGCLAAAAPIVLAPIPASPGTSPVTPNANLIVIGL